MPEMVESLYMNGVEVGVITNPSYDNFDYYGAWKPTRDVELYNRFLAMVEREGGARVEIGKIGSALTGTVELEPDQEIGKHRDRLRDTLPNTAIWYRLNA